MHHFTVTMVCGTRERTCESGSRETETDARRAAEKFLADRPYAHHEAAMLRVESEDFRVVATRTPFHHDPAHREWVATPRV